MTQMSAKATTAPASAKSPVPLSGMWSIPALYEQLLDPRTGKIVRIYQCQCGEVV
jgi:hypothetical protein